MILTAVTFLLFVLIMGVVVDIGRVYAVQGKAQSASDAALLGAVATVSTTPLATEMVRLFDANFPASYMGASVGTISAAEVAPDVYEAEFDVVVPSVVLQLFGIENNDIHILSQVTRGFETMQNRRLELAMVLDNTGSMAGAKIEALKNASRDLVDILFGPAETLQNVHISIVPYDVAVNIGPNRESWIQAPHVAHYTSFAPNGFVSNRNNDSPPNGYNDYTDVLPQTEETRFRVPNNAPFAGCPDTAGTSLPLMRFAMNNKSELMAMINTMIASGCTRINVGLLWGWMTLSPQWMGQWDPSKPDLPASSNPLLDKAVIVMTDGHNTVFNGAGGSNNDNITTALMCSAIKSQGITIYSVGFGGQVNEELLRNCASLPTYFWLAPTEEDLREAFQQIADDLIFNTIRLSQ